MIEFLASDNVELLDGGLGTHDKATETTNGEVKGVSKLANGVIADWSADTEVTSIHDAHISEEVFSSSSESVTLLASFFEKADNGVEHGIDCGADVGDLVATHDEDTFVKTALFNGASDAMEVAKTANKSVGNEPANQGNGQEGADSSDNGSNELILVFNAGGSIDGGGQSVVELDQASKRALSVSISGFTLLL